MSDTKNKKTIPKIKKFRNMNIISHPDQVKLLGPQGEVNKRNLHILRTKLMGKLDGGGKSAMELLGRE